MPEVPAGRNTVTVACKLPGGLILELDQLKKETSTLAGRDVDMFIPTGERVVIAGSNADHRDAGNPGRAVAGYGLTEVRAEFWEAWLKQHKGFPPLEKGLLFAQPTADRANSQAHEQTSLKTGRDALDPDRPMPGIMRDTGPRG